MVTVKELRQKYLEFFKEKGHAIIKSASLIPENDPTVLFTTAGMHPLVPYLMGEKHPAGARLVDIQKCVRTDDIDEVGDTTHHTFFEMMGNWSLGDYFKEDSIKWSFEFLTSPKWIGLDINRLAVSVFAGDADAPFDEEAFNFWKNLGIPEARIAKLPKKNNWWWPAGVTGPCGPDTEIFYWVGDVNNIPDSFNDDNNLWVEIWNNVFMQYSKKLTDIGEEKYIKRKELLLEDFYYEPLAQKNVDTGMGLERVLAIMNGFSDNYKTDLWVNIIKKIEELSGKKYGENQEITNWMRIVADHIKAAIFIMGDEKGVNPSNTDKGYVVRKLIRRAVRNCWLIIEREDLMKGREGWTAKLAEIVINDYKEIYGELEKNKNFIINNFIEEEKKFNKTLEKGLQELHKLAKIKGGAYNVSGKDGFDLYQTYGLPEEVILDELKFNLTFCLKIDDEILSDGDLSNEKIEEDKRKREEKEKAYNEEEFKNFKEKFKKEFAEELKKHQDLSRTASAGMFKGGLADSGEETRKLHTAAHLMLAALRQVLGGDVIQKGSNITPERLRFDFSHSAKMTPEQIKQVEDIVNEAIAQDLPIVCQEKTLDEAREEGAMGIFDSKYGEKVKVYAVGENNTCVSKEICGGPHADHTGELGHFKITKEESSSSGVRRIKAILE